MSKYIATVKTTQQWFKTIEVKKGDEPEEAAEDNFVKTHYENFDDSWQNALFSLSSTFLEVVVLLIANSLILASLSWLFFQLQIQHNFHQVMKYLFLPPNQVIHLFRYRVGQ